MTELWSAERIGDAARLLRAGELVAFPTETVYGLGGDATNDLAVARIFEAKGRPRFNPLIVHVPDLEAARKLGATDNEIHDTILIAAAFSMYNRYVDGLGTVQPSDPTMYEQMGKQLAEKGYTTPLVRQATEV